MDQTPYRSIPVSTGGTFTFDFQSNDITHIGTGCKGSSVGIYLPLCPAGTKCFISNIRARGGQTEAAMQRLRQLVCEKLTAHAQANSWSLNDIKTAIEGPQARHLFVLCRSADDGVVECVIDGIEDFLGHIEIPKHCLRTEDQGMEGFVVDQKSVQLWTLERSLFLGTIFGSDEPGDDMFEPKEEKALAEGEWEFIV